MKLPSTMWLSLILAFTAGTNIMAGEGAPDTLVGKWLFTHIVMDGGDNKMEVNRTMEFVADGTVINYHDPEGQHEASRGTYELTTDTILYRDGNGEQKWKIIEFEEKTLHVDQHGAEMFFLKQ
jgi:hypothetical protein